jgi:uncharacterized SAM-binding protein YcdF (DUF218 family)
MTRRGKWLAAGALLGVLLAAAYLLLPLLLAEAGRVLVRDDRAPRADCAVVLSTGIEYYPRLIEAAALYREGRVAWIAINGNRKSDVLRRLEALGLEPAAPWFETSLRVLELLGVPRGRVVTVSAEDAYDTVSEAQQVGPVLLKRGFKSIVVTTSRSHTRRAGYIWERLFGGRLQVHTAPARDDPYDPAGWWRDGRQVRWVLAEYGAWLYLHWKLGSA